MTQSDVYAYGCVCLEVIITLLYIFVADQLMPVVFAGFHRKGSLAQPERSGGPQRNLQL